MPIIVREFQIVNICFCESFPFDSFAAVRMKAAPVGRDRRAAAPAAVFCGAANNF
jgi:hypothetical protein